NPAVLFAFIGIAGCVPDFGGTKVGAIGIGIANALDGAEMAFIVKRFKAGEVRMESKRIVDFENFFRADAKARAGAGVVIIGIWNQRIQTVVPAGHLQNDKNGTV